MYGKWELSKEAQNAIKEVLPSFGFTLDNESQVWKKHQQGMFLNPDLVGDYTLQFINDRLRIDLFSDEYCRNEIGHRKGEIFCYWGAAGWGDTDGVVCQLKNTMVNVYGLRV